MEVNFDGTPGDYHYSQDRLGKSASGVAKSGPQSQRNPTAQLKAGGADRETGDHGGHLIAHSFGGQNDPANIDAQAANVNQRDQASVERNVAKLALNFDNVVFLGVDNYTREDSDRPDATVMTVGVQNNITGAVDIGITGFTNAGHDEQQEWNDIALRTDPVDPRQEEGLTGDQREIANSMIDWEDSIDHDVGSGWTVTHFDTGSANDMGDTADLGVGDGDDGGGESSGDNGTDDRGGESAGDNGIDDGGGIE